MARMQPRPDSGFTLIEMLVSLTLMALAAAMMLEGLGSGQRLWAVEAAQTARTESVEAAQTVLRARIERLHPSTRNDSNGVYTDVEGSNWRLTFTAPPAESDRPGAMRRYRLSLDERGDLVLGVGLARSEPGAEPSFTDRTLLRNVGGLDISYFGPGASGGAPQWRPDWTRRATPPELIRIRLLLPPGDRRLWPDLIIRPAATVDAQCIIDPETGECRGRA
ncbi:MAG TPA: prepilin-type N-terminal cleavage/methylation domain-containing protein [Caulobacteraceae bacterium]|jgi:general secretion pathway protein J|nr:prepilin-type N-terminal cleavage/methylation domain-containing protein [Caulobacteraceae bacterium]